MNNNNEGTRKSTKKSRTERRNGCQSTDADEKSVNDRKILCGVNGRTAIQKAEQKLRAKQE